MSTLFGVKDAANYYFLILYKIEILFACNEKIIINL
jgi:hypothetical protein